MTDRVTLRLRGRMLERFVGRALREGVWFQIVERTGAREMKLCATEKNAVRLLELAEEYGMKISVTGESGKPRLKKKVMDWNTLPLGIILSLLLIGSFTSRFWRVEAVSLDAAADEETLQAICESVKEMGITPGILRGDVDRDALAMQIQIDWPELTHVSVRAEGVFLRVEVASEETVPEVYDISAGRDLAASRDAIVVYVEELAGKACVHAGDTVRCGQTLIRGEERIDTEETREIRALGKVIGRVWFTAEYEAPTTQTVARRTGNRRVCSQVRLGSWTWALDEADDFASQETETELLPIGGLYLPLRIERTDLWETVCGSVEMDMNALRENTGTKALETARSELPDGAVETDYWIDYTEKDGILTARATVEAEMDIAVERGRMID